MFLFLINDIKGYQNKWIVADSAEPKSNEYRRKLDSLGEDDKTTRLIYKNIKEILSLKDSTQNEGLCFIFSDSQTDLKNTNSIKARQIGMSKKMKNALECSKPNTIIGIHNHLGSSLPSHSDLMAASKRKYKYGLIACHNGDIIKYKVDNEINITKRLYESWLKDFSENINELNRKLQNRGVQIWKL